MSNERFFKEIVNDNVVAIGTGGNNGIEITESEYNAIMEVIRNRPSAEGKGYRLRTDLTWEEYDLPPEPPVEDEITLDDALAMLRELGVDV